MSRLFIVFSVLISLHACAPDKQINTATDLDLFSGWLAGAWSNTAQIDGLVADGLPAAQRPARYAMRYTQINAPAIKGRLFAIENYDSEDGFEGAISRVSLHRFMMNEDASVILHEILFLKNKALRQSLVRNLAPLETISEDDIRAREDCRLYWQWTGKRFEGKTREGQCVTNSYTDRDITVEGYGALSASTLIRHDRNYEMTGEEIQRPGYTLQDIFQRAN